eukprot:GEMP01044617.1.p1 GENE.GEMP01044617.1~~GEMP01044617.1.p1  ORF type:complete len:266 (+),score=34.96 GEMP01044617.1:161-958(+)
MFDISPLPPDAIHVMLGSLESEVDEFTANAVSQSSHLMSIIRRSEKRNSTAGVGMGFFASEDFQKLRNLIHESRADEVDDFLTKLGEDQLFEFGSIFVSGVCDSMPPHDLRFDATFARFETDYLERGKMNYLWYSQRILMKYSDHPDETTRNIAGLVDIAKLTARLDYLRVRAFVVAHWKKEAAMMKAAEAVWSRSWFSPLKLISILGMLGTVFSTADEKKWKETQEQRDRATIRFTDEEKKRLCAAGKLKTSFDKAEAEMLSYS